MGRQLSPDADQHMKSKNSHAHAKSLHDTHHCLVLPAVHNGAVCFSVPAD
eukprot:NODE_16672_length_219_cov_122.914634.p1 GENE.NODE_16672_length_219_cov_122.914634~~NODE_16672_length_219_cov_122.914634.p1  ORF type:complete len:50 (+),score=1.68 NODE_16672_length_219_cov_122.914634:38-187(+)